ncbi:MAG: hypothetical protein R3E10_12570 [Gemmatimonadota bacterium]
MSRLLATLIAMLLAFPTPKSLAAQSAEPCPDTLGGGLLLGTSTWNHVTGYIQLTMPLPPYSLVVPIGHTHTVGVYTIPGGGVRKVDCSLSLI